MGNGLLGSVEQHEFCILSSLNGCDSFASPMTEVDVGIADVTITTFEFLQNGALRIFAFISKHFVWANVVGQSNK